MSGLSRTPGKRVWVYPHRGFESRPLRHTCLKETIPNQVGDFSLFNYFLSLSDLNAPVTVSETES